MLVQIQGNLISTETILNITETKNMGNWGLLTPFFRITLFSGVVINIEIKLWEPQDYLEDNNPDPIAKTLLEKEGYQKCNGMRDELISYWKPLEQLNIPIIK